MITTGCGASVLRIPRSHRFYCKALLGTRINNKSMNSEHVPSSAIQMSLAVACHFQTLGVTGIFHHGHRKSTDRQSFRSVREIRTSFPHFQVGPCHL